MFLKQEAGFRLPHGQRTVYWVRRLKPDADDALLIAAMGHDIYRPAERKGDFLDENFLKGHQVGSAEMIKDFLLKEGAEEDLAERVKDLISHHEEGGNEDQNLLKDADSISFFETKIDKFTCEKLAESNKEEIKRKFDWMYDRITSEKAKEIARPMYEEAIKRLTEKEA